MPRGVAAACRCACSAVNDDDDARRWNTSPLPSPPSAGAVAPPASPRAERSETDLVTGAGALGSSETLTFGTSPPPRVAIRGSDADERIDLVLSPPLPSDSVVVSTAKRLRAERPLTGRGSRGGAGGRGIASRSAPYPRRAPTAAPAAARRRRGRPGLLLRPLAAASSLDDHAHSPFMMFTDESQPRSSAPTARSTGASRAARCIP